MKKYEQKIHIEAFSETMLENEYPRAHCHLGLALVYCVQGPTEFLLDGEPYRMETGSVMVVDRFRVHSCTAGECLRVTALPPGCLQKNPWYLRCDLWKHPYIRPGANAKKISELMEQLLQRSWYAPSEILGLCNRVLEILCRVCGTRAEDQPEECSVERKLLLYLGEHFRETVTLEQTAKELAYSKYYISRILNRLMGMNFSTFVNQLRLCAVEESLRETPERSVKELAEENGFRSKQTFYRAFRNTCGMTPRRYFQQYQKEDDA